MRSGVRTLFAARVAKWCCSEKRTRARCLSPVNYFFSRALVGQSRSALNCAQGLSLAGNAPADVHCQGETEQIRFLLRVDAFAAASRTENVERKISVKFSSVRPGPASDGETQSRRKSFRDRMRCWWSDAFESQFVLSIQKLRKFQISDWDVIASRLARLPNPNMCFRREDRHKKQTESKKFEKLRAVDACHFPSRRECFIRIYEGCAWSSWYLQCTHGEKTTLCLG